MNRDLSDLSDFRQRLKRSRLALSANQRDAASAAALARLRCLKRFRRAEHLAAYVGFNGELDPMPLLMLAARLGKACYLPILHPFQQGRLWFCRWQPGDRLAANRFGILEPSRYRGRVRPARHLDLVIVPVLGFDSGCQRLGMGGGFYDRTFAFVTRSTHVRRPFLLGLAYQSQHCDALPYRSWDVGLDAVVTECRLYKAPPKKLAAAHAASRFDS